MPLRFECWNHRCRWTSTGLNNQKGLIINCAKNEKTCKLKCSVTISAITTTFFNSVRLGKCRRDPDDVWMDRERTRTRKSRRLHSQCRTQRQHDSLGRYSRIRTVIKTTILRIQNSRGNKRMKFKLPLFRHFLEVSSLNESVALKNDSCSVS